MKNKNVVFLDEKNFNRVKKNLAQNLKKDGISISQSQIAEVLSKSIGFSNYHHAQNEEFKTEKFTNVDTNKQTEEKIQKDYPGIKGIAEQLIKIKESAENRFLFNNVKNIKLSESSNAFDKINVENLVSYVKSAEGFVFNECLSSKELIFSDLCNYLNFDMKYQIKFDIKHWLDCLIQNNMFNSIYIGLNINTILLDALKYLKEKEEELFLIFEMRICDYYKKTISIEDKDFQFKLINFDVISFDNLENIFKIIENEEVKVLFLEELIKNKLFNFEKLSNSDKDNFIHLIKIIRKLAPKNYKKGFENIFDYKSVMDLKNKILLRREEEDIKSYYNMLYILFNNVNIKLSGILYKELYFSIVENMPYLMNIEEVNSLIQLIKYNLSKL